MACNFTEQKGKQSMVAAYYFFVVKLSGQGLQDDNRFLQQHDA